MPRTNNLNRNRPAPKSRPTSSNGYDVTTLPAHPKNPEVEETLPAYAGSNQLTLPVHSKDSKAAELAAATEPGSDQDVVAFRGAYNAPPPPVEDAETKAVRVAQQLVDATVSANQVAKETRDEFDGVNQLLANEPCPYPQNLAKEKWERHVIAAQQAEETYLDSLEAIKVADKIKAENAPMPAYGGDYLAPPNLEERTEEWDRIEAEYVRRQEQALDAYQLAVQDVAKKEETYAILRLEAEIGEMDRVAAMDAEEVAEEDVIEIDGVVYGRAW